MHPQRVVLAVARTLTSAVRLLEALDSLRSDLRIQVLFTVDPTSAFVEGVTRLLAEVGARVVPWERMAESAVDLVVTASENVNLDDVKAPVVVLPHGVGFHKYVPDSAGTGVRLSGLVPRRYLAEREVLLVASHHSQVAQLERACRGAAARTVVVGDICFDRMLASRRLRPVYRRRLGADDGRRLVVITSTWGEQSLWGRCRQLPCRLLAELPADEYQVAMVLHPNIWSWHSPWQVRSWLADARESGLLLVPPTAGWQACVVAADVVIGDHGSVTFYAAALGVPVLLAAVGTQAVPGTALADLARLAPRLRPAEELRPQVEHAFGNTQSELASSLVGAAFERVGDASRGLRRLLYDQMGLPEPESTAVTRAWPPPSPEGTTVRSFAVTTEIIGVDTVEIRRYPALVAQVPAESATCFGVLAVYDDEPDPAMVETASVIVRQSVSEATLARTWAAESLRQYPGALVAAAATVDGCRIAVRGGAALIVTSGPGGPVDAMLLAAGCYAHLRAGTLRDGKMRDGKMRLALGARRQAVDVRVDAAGD